MTRIAPFSAIALVAVLGACSQVSSVLNRQPAAPAAPAAAPQVAAPDPASAAEAQAAPVVEAPIPATAAQTAEDLDTTTPEEKAAAQAPAAGGQRLGEVTASLGSPTEPGLWMQTALVKSVQPGRIENPATGKSGSVELRPISGDGGATLSLAAMRLLEIPLTDIPTIVVYTR